MTNYSLKSCEELITNYLKSGGQLEELEEGSLGLGTILLHGAKGHKTIIIKEYFISAWSSGHSIRMYKKMPKKYEKLLVE